MRVLNFSPGADTGGQAWRLKEAFDRHSDIEYRSSVRQLNYIDYPRDMNYQQSVRFMKWADVFHANDGVQGLHIRGKPVVMHYHGTKFRMRTERKLAEMEKLGARGLVSTLDLLLDDRLEWLPSPHDLDFLATFSAPVDDGVYRIAHAPTKRGVKSTEPLILAVRRLAEEMPVELVLIEKQTWQKTQELKGTADVFFDQVLLGYGNNAIEAWGMGLPVIAGGQPDTLAKMRSTFGELPFFEATEDTIYEALRELADPNARAEWAKRGLVFAERFHAYEVVVRQLENVYRSLTT